MHSLSILHGSNYPYCRRNRGQQLTSEKQLTIQPLSNRPDAISGFSCCKRARKDPWRWDDREKLGRNHCGRSLHLNGCIIVLVASVISRETRNKVFFANTLSYTWPSYQAMYLHDRYFCLPTSISISCFFAFFVIWLITHGKKNIKHIADRKN